MRTYELDGKKLVAAPFSINVVCEFDRLGIKPEQIIGGGLNVIRAYIAISTGMSLEVAGNILESHFMNGGDFNEITSIMVEEIGKSGFFQKAMERATQTIAESENENTEETEKVEKKPTRTVKVVK